MFSTRRTRPGYTTTPIRDGGWESTTQQYGHEYKCDYWFTGTAAGAHGWLLGLTGYRTVATVGADLNDAYIRISGNNTAVNQANYIMRGINLGLINRSPGVIGTLHGAAITAETRSGSTTGSAVGLYVMAEIGDTQAGSSNYGIDIALRRQAATNPTSEAGINVRQVQASGTVDSETWDAVLRVTSSNPNTTPAFTRFCDAGDTQYILTTTSGKVTLFKINIAGTAYYVRASASAVTVEANEA